MFMICDECVRPILLHKGEEYTRDVDKGLKLVAKNWNYLKRRLKPILKEIKAEREKEKEQTVYLDGIKWIVKTIQMQIGTASTEVKKDEVTTTPSVVAGNRSRLLTKPAKVPTWTRDLTLETFSKQLQTCSDILEEISEYTKYADLMKSLKTN